MARAISLFAVLAALACGRTALVRFEVFEPLPDGGVDGGRDAGADAGLPFDAGVKPCVEGRFALTPAVPVVLLVIDKSGSMDQSFSGIETKWEALGTALASALPAVDQTMELGLLFYPVGEDQTCSSFVSANPEPGLGRVATILQRLAEAEPAGGTPTADAVQAAENVLRTRRTASSARALVLATDGVPNCNAALDPRSCRCDSRRCISVECVDDDRTVQRIASAADAGIPTYVVGIETLGASLTADLDRMAIAGARPLPPGGKRYFSATSTTELAQAFTSIRDQVARCTFLTNSVPNATGSIRVELDGVVVPFDSSGQRGWNWNDRPNGELMFHGASCQQVMGMRRTLDAIVACGN